VETPRYRIKYEEGLEKKLREIPKTIRERIKIAIEERLMTSPNEYGKPLLKEWKSCRRIRVGDYRIIYQVLEEKVLVLIIEIDHRKNVYD